MVFRLMTTSSGEGGGTGARCFLTSMLPFTPRHCKRELPSRMDCIGKGAGRTPHFSAFIARGPPARYDVIRHFPNGGRAVIPAICPYCSTNFRLPDSQAGLKVRCKVCDATFAVPDRPQDDVPVLEEAEPSRRGSSRVKESDDR